MLPSLKAKAAIKLVEEIKKIYEEISTKLTYAQVQSILYINKKRKIVPQLKKRDKVYLYIKNLRTK